MVKKNKIIFVTTLFGAFITAISFICPFILSYLVEDISLEYSPNRLYRYILIMITVYVASFFLQLLSSAIVTKFSVAFKTRESHVLYGKLMNMQYPELIEKQPTYLADRIFHSIETIYSYYATVAKSYIISSAMIIACVAVLYYFSIILGAIFTVVVPLYIFLYWLLNRRLQEKCVYLQKNNSKCFADVISIINEVDYYKQLPKHDGVLKMIDKNILSINNENAAVSSSGTNLKHVIETFLNITYAISYILISTLFALNEVVLSDYVLISMIISMIFPAVKDIISANLSVRDLKAAKTFIEEEMSLSEEKNGNKPLEDIKEIVFSIPKLGYGENILLRDVSLRINQGEKIFISGPSGSGKSTIVKGLMKFIEVDGIYVNGIEIHAYDNASYRSKIAYLSQNLPIIHGTIEENILLGECANIDILRNKKFMQKFFDLPNGLKTEIYDNGANLSGGDKQKIALARLYMRNVQVIILDETLNAIDIASKNEILSTLFEDFSGSTIIMVSHETEFAAKFTAHYTVSDSRLIRIK